MHPLVEYNVRKQVTAFSSAALLGFDEIPAWSETRADDISDRLNRRPRWPTETE